MINGGFKKTNNPLRARARRQKSVGANFVFSDLGIARLRLGVVAGRLNRSDRFVARLRAEGIKISPADYIARLQKSKARLIKETQALEKGHLKERAESERFTAQPQRIAHGGQDWWGKKGFGYDGYQHDLLFASAQQEDTGCRSEQGTLSPSWAGATTVSGSSIHHGSKASFYLEELNLDRFGVTLGHAWLNDNAAIWRDDNPDVFVTGYEINWEWPAAPCDMWVLFRVYGKQTGSFVNGADDGGGCKTLLVFAHTDENGDFPKRVIDETGTVIFESNSSASFISDYYGCIKAFPINRGAIAQVSMANIVALFAQDGKVSLTAGFHVGELPEDARPAKLWYMLIPR